MMGLYNLGRPRLMIRLNTEHGKHPVQCLAGVGSSVNVSSLPCARMRNSGGETSGREVPAQYLGDEAWQVEK